MNILMFVSAIFYFIAAVFGFVNVFVFREYNKFWVPILYIALTISCVYLGVYWEA